MAHLGYPDPEVLNCLLLTDKTVFASQLGPTYIVGSCSPSMFPGCHYGVFTVTLRTGFEWNEGRGAMCLRDLRGTTTPIRRRKMKPRSVSEVFLIAFRQLTSIRSP